MLDFKHSYENAKSKSMVDFSALEVRIFINGYDLATYKNDKVILENQD